MRKILVDKSFVDLNKWSCGLPWKHDSNCFNFKMPDEFVLDSAIYYIKNPLEIETLVIGSDLEDYSFISRMSNLEQLYIYSGKNIDNLDFVEDLVNLRQLYISESNIKEIDSLVELVREQNAIFRDLEGIKKLQFGFTAICVKSSKDLDGQALVKQGWNISEIIVNDKQLRE